MEEFINKINIILTNTWNKIILELTENNLVNLNEQLFNLYKNKDFVKIKHFFNTNELECIQDLNKIYVSLLTINDYILTFIDENTYKNKLIKLLQFDQ